MLSAAQITVKDIELHDENALTVRLRRLRDTMLATDRPVAEALRPLFGQLEYSSKVQQCPRYSALFSAARLLSASLGGAQRRLFL